MGILQDQSIAHDTTHTTFAAFTSETYQPFSTKAGNELNDSTYGRELGWGGNRYAPPALGGFFDISPDQKKVGPVWSVDNAMASSRTQYLGNLSSGRAQSDAQGTGSLLGQLSYLLNGPQTRAGAGTPQTWNEKPEANKYKATFSRYKTSNRSAYNDTAVMNANGSSEALSSGGAWVGYTPMSPYASIARQTAAMLSTVKLGEDLDWGDMSDVNEDGNINFSDFFVYADVAGGKDPANEVNNPVGITGGFGIKEMMRSAAFAGKVSDDLSEDQKEAVEQGGF